MNADDRQVIIDALNTLADLGVPSVKQMRAADALALLDKPEPESAEDTDKLLADLKNVLIPTTEHFQQTQDAIAKGIIQAFASRIRAETLDGSFIDIRDRAYKNGYDAGLNSLKPTGTP